LGGGGGKATASSLVVMAGWPYSSMTKYPPDLQVLLIQETVHLYHTSVIHDDTSPLVGCCPF
jgi:hypothetical protein